MAAPYDEVVIGVPRADGLSGTVGGWEGELAGVVVLDDNVGNEDVACPFRSQGFGGDTGIFNCSAVVNLSC